MDVVRGGQQGAGLPPEIDLKTTNRIGDTERARAVLHIGEMRAQGFLKDEDAQLRLNFIGEAQTATQITAVLADLPGYPEDTPGLLDGVDWDNPHWYVPVLMCGIALGLTIAITPGVALAAAGAINTGLGMAVFVPSLIVGIITFFVSLVSLMIKLDS
jgi:hypothetical protein